MTKKHNPNNPSEFPDSSGAFPVEDSTTENAEALNQRQPNFHNPKLPTVTRYQYPKTQIQDHQSRYVNPKSSSDVQSDNRYFRDPQYEYNRTFEENYWLLPILRFLLISSIPVLMMTGLVWAFIQNQKSNIKATTPTQEQSVSQTSPHQHTVPPVDGLDSQTNPNLPSMPPGSDAPISVLPTPSNSQIPTYVAKDPFYNALQKDTELNTIIDGIVNIAVSNGLPSDVLSITLIDLNRDSYAEYRGESPHFPASVVKLFWMAIVSDAIQTKGVNAVSQDYSMASSVNLSADLDKLIKESDNEAGSRIVDFLTGTKSGLTLPELSFQDWATKRYALNSFFQKKGYGDLNISQKTFPIPFLQYDGPEGRDAQIRGDTNNPIRNYLSTDQAARLMYEIMQGTLGGEHNQKMRDRLFRDLRSDWRSIDPNSGHFNPVQAFMGEGLSEISPAIKIYSKAGWTSQTRQEVAYIEDGSKRYILAIFAEDKKYAEDEHIFPKIAKYVHQTLRL